MPKIHIVWKFYVLHEQKQLYRFFPVAPYTQHFHRVKYSKLFLSILFKH